MKIHMATSTTLPASSEGSACVWSSVLQGPRTHAIIGGLGFDIEERMLLVRAKETLDGGVDSDAWQM